MNTTVKIMPPKYLIVRIHYYAFYPDEYDFKKMIKGEAFSVEITQIKSIYVLNKFKRTYYYEFEFSPNAYFISYEALPEELKDFSVQPFRKIYSNGKFVKSFIKYSVFSPIHHYVIILLLSLYTFDFFIKKHISNSIFRQNLNNCSEACKEKLVSANFSFVFGVVLLLMPIVVIFISGFLAKYFLKKDSTNRKIVQLQLIFIFILFIPLILNFIQSNSFATLVEVNTKYRLSWSQIFIELFSPLYL